MRCASARAWQPFIDAPPRTAQRAENYAEARVAMRVRFRAYRRVARGARGHAYYFYARTDVQRKQPRRVSERAGDTACRDAFSAQFVMPRLLVRSERSGVYGMPRLVGLMACRDYAACGSDDACR